MKINFDQLQNDLKRSMITSISQRPYTVYNEVNRSKQKKNNKQEKITNNKNNKLVKQANKNSYAYNKSITNSSAYKKVNNYTAKYMKDKNKNHQNHRANNDNSKLYSSLFLEKSIINNYSIYQDYVNKQKLNQFVLDFELDYSKSNRNKQERVINKQQRVIHQRIKKKQKQLKNQTNHHRISQKQPQKFNNIKTIKQMTSFIQTMNKIQSFKQNNKSNKLKYFTNNSSNYNFIQSVYSQQQKQLSHSQQFNEKAKQVTQRLYDKEKMKFDKDKKGQFHCNKKFCQQILYSVKKAQQEQITKFTGQPLKYIPKHMRSTEIKSKLYRSLQLSINKSTQSATQSNSQQYNINDEQGEKSIQTNPLYYSTIHDRLHEDWKVRRLYLQKIQQQALLKQKYLSSFNHQSRIITQQEKQHLKNYVPFYDRLQQLTQWYRHKQDVYNKLGLDSSGEIMFRPNYNLRKIQKSYKTHNKLNKTQQSDNPSIDRKDLMKKLSILSKKKEKCVKQKCKQLQKTVNKKQNQQFLPIRLNSKTQQIVNNQQRKYLNKLKSIFYSKKHQIIKINQNKLSQLSQKQFEILYPLISKIQQISSSNNVKKSQKTKNQQTISRVQKQLEKIINKFYQGLQISQKHQLKRLYLLSQCRIKQKRRAKKQKILELQQKQKQRMIIEQNKKNKLLSNSNVIGNKSKQISFKIFDTQRDYCQRLSEFI